MTPASPTKGTTNTTDETDSIVSIYGKYAPSHISEAESVAISGSMPPSEILAQLSRHGCEDVTSQLNLDSVTQSSASNGGSGDIYRGLLYDGRRVGVKCLRILVGMDEEGAQQVKRASRELYIWSRYKHPNIQELIGVAVYKSRVAMVSPWMKYGNLSWYISKHPEADRYNLCVQTAAAVAYLRESGVVHGDIKGENYLVSEDQIVKLADFGSSLINQCSLRFTSSASSPHMTLRWTAPEIFLEETQQTYEGDVYALGMTILEIITGSVPWSGMRNPAVIHKLSQRSHPSRPEAYLPVDGQLRDRLWDLMTRCWSSKPQQRPFAMEVRDELDAINKLHRPPLYRAEGIDTDEISIGTYPPIKNLVNHTPSSDPSPSPVLISRKSLLERLLWRPVNRSLNPLKHEKRGPRSVVSLASIGDLSLTQPLSSLANSTSSVTSTPLRWSGNMTDSRRSHRESPPIPSARSILGIPRYKSSSAVLDVYEEGDFRGLSSSLREPVVNSDLNGSLDNLHLVDRTHRSSRTLSSGTRKALLIGAPWNYKDTSRPEVGWELPCFTLDDISNDFRRLESIFLERAYSIQKLIGGFNWATALARVAEFLDDSKAGDVRAVFFDGVGDLSFGVFSLILSESSTLGARSHIPFKEWEQNIRDHSLPGVVVFSIMAHGWSGQIMKQEFDRRVWEVPALMKASSEEEPMYLTFASSNDGHCYCGGLTPPPERAPIGEHSIHALVGAIQSVDATTSSWAEFFEEFDRQFLRTQSYVSLYERERTGDQNLSWRLNHPQTPRFSASAFVALSDIF